jgi:Flp pilus assembly protein TadG
MSKAFKSQRGQTVVEFAFMLPLLVLFLIGILDFSILLYDKAIVTNASREGARQGSIFRSDPSSGNYIPLTSAQVSTAVTSYISGRAATFGTTSVTTTTNWSTTSPPSAYSWSSNYTSAISGGAIRVTVTYTYTFLSFPRVASWVKSTGWSNTADLTAETIMRME